MFSNPKRTKCSATCKESWFDFYAGYSPAFVKDVLSRLPSTAGPILDPWNGSGTTTTAAHELGVDSTGTDINPAMIVVAKAKLLTPGVVESLVPLAEDIVRKARRLNLDDGDNDPITEWFTPTGAMHLRSLAEAICTLTTPVTKSRQLYKEASLALVSDLTAFFLVALFKTARSFMVRFQASNPTWVKSPTHTSARLRPSLDSVIDRFKQHVHSMAAGIVPVRGRANTTIMLASSDRLPMGNGVVEAVIASPPYCTRIDYAVATKPELAILGCPLSTDFKELRRKMLGGPVISQNSFSPSSDWGSECLSLLETIYKHRTKGSANYYHKIFVQYYEALHKSLREINRVAAANANCFLVVQDSHYKDVHVDIAAHVIEMAEKLGWEMVARKNYKTALLMARLNPRSQKYGPRTEATESVLWFRTAS